VNLQKSEQVVPRPVLSDRGALQRRRRPHRHLLSDGHGAEPDGQGRQGDRHRCHFGAHPRPALRHGQNQGAVRTGADGGGRRGARHPESSAPVTSLDDDPQHTPHGRRGLSRGRSPLEGKRPQNRPRLTIFGRVIFDRRRI